MRVVPRRQSWDMAKQTAREHGLSKKYPRRNKEPSGHKSINPLKSKIRDLERCLARSEHLPAGVKIEKERALAGYKQDLEQAMHGKQRQHMISKYHKVRFFERQKATRALRKVQKQLLDDSDQRIEDEARKASVHAAQVDVNYTIYYPLTEKYVSLFPLEKRASDKNGSQSPETGKDLSIEGKRVRPPMWAVIERCMEEGTLDQLRDGKLNTLYSIHPTMTRAKPQDTLQRTKQLPSSNTKAKATANDHTVTTEHGDDSDGGFFEP